MYAVDPLVAIGKSTDRIVNSLLNVAKLIGSDVFIYMPLKEPAVSRRTLELTAGTLWVVVGVFLCLRALLWIPNVTSSPIMPIILGTILGLLKGHFIFARLAQKNITRIYALSPHKEKICVFAFQAMQSYLIVILMIALGMLLRLSPMPRNILIGIYILVGVALVVGSRTYFLGNSHSG